MKQQPVWVFCFFKPFLGFYKRNKFLLFKKNTKTHSVLFTLHHVISPFSELHNNNLLQAYLLWHSKVRVMKCTHLYFRKVLLVSSLQSGKARQAYAQQREIATRTQTLQFHARFVHVTCYSSASLKDIFSTHHLVWSSYRKSFYADKAEKLIKICRFYRAEEVTSRIYSNCSNYSSLFFKSFKFRCCSFVSSKKKLQLSVIVQVCCLFCFLFHGTLFKGKEKMA